jgi:hypothetical protein
MPALPPAFSFSLSSPFSFSFLFLAELACETFAVSHWERVTFLVRGMISVQSGWADFVVLIFRDVVTDTPWRVYMKVV